MILAATPEEMLQELRDIHLPELPPSGAAEGMWLWPFLVLAGVVLIVTALAYMRRTRWRREARAALARIDPASTDAWPQLTALLRRVGLRTDIDPPGSVFAPPEQIGPDDARSLHDHIARAIR